MTDGASTAMRLPWLGTVRQWHWISSAICLVGMLLFAITGITLNHAGQIEGRAAVTSQERLVPPALLAELVAGAAGETGPAGLPPLFQAWAEQELAIRLTGRELEWADGELYIGLPRPGGDAWLSVDLDSGGLLYEASDRGWIAYLNDLHKARNTGTAWLWFIDVFAVACIVFCLSGLVLLQRHAGSRPTTWPLVGLGLVIPVLLALLFMHN